MTGTSVQPRSRDGEDSGKRNVVELWHNVTCEQIALGEVRVARQDERVDPRPPVGVDLGEHLRRVADDRRSGTAARPTDPGPQRLLDEAVAPGRIAQCGLALHPHRTCVERP